MSHAFDRTAARYDADEDANAALQHMRGRSIAALKQAFAPLEGKTLLEIGSGTGREAAVLAREGAELVLVDPSTALLDVARRAVVAVRDEALVGAHAVTAGALATLTSIYGRARFDGAYSSLGAVNGEPHLADIAEALAELLRPGAVLVLSFLNRYAAYEVAWFGARGRWSDALRRLRGPLYASTLEGGVRDHLTHYFTHRDVAAAFASSFRVEHVEALPLVMPPTYLAPMIAKHPRTFAWLARVEPQLARQRLLRGLGDHTLVVLRRRP